MVIREERPTFNQRLAAKVRALEPKLEYWYPKREECYAAIARELGLPKDSISYCFSYSRKCTHPWSDGACKDCPFAEHIPFVCSSEQMKSQLISNGWFASSYNRTFTKDGYTINIIDTNLISIQVGKTIIEFTYAYYKQLEDMINVIQRNISKHVSRKTKQKPSRRNKQKV